ncbi:MAG: TAXI family TRAP transporter solute-binding subunit [Rhodospirillales bacterium]|nr:TAXI family TRAP transporter solute-binding subunit [Rhodospirillales bacterium]
MYAGKLLVAGGLALAMTSAASAETVGIGSTKTGAVAQVTATISKAVSEHGGGLQMRKQTMGGTQQYIPVVNSGELAFGISNLAQYWMAISGTGLSKPNKYDNLRLVSTMMKFSVSFVVPKASGITKVSDLKGKRLSYGLKAAPLFAAIHEGGLATAGLSYDDVKHVPAVGLVQHWRLMMAGKVDGVIAAAGTGFVKQMNAKIQGGIRHISFPSGPESLQAMHKFFPKTYWSTIEPRKGLTGVVEPTNFITYDYMLWTHKGLSDETAYTVAKVMHQQVKQLKDGGPLWKSYEANTRLAKDQGMPYHPGAIKYYKEAGLWKR